MQRKKVFVDHDPEATFLYVLRLPDIAGTLFDETTQLSAVIEVPVTSGINQLNAQIEWSGTCRTRLKINGGSLLGATSARLLIKIVHEGITYTTDPVNIRMVG